MMQGGRVPACVRVAGVLLLIAPAVLGARHLRRTRPVETIDTTTPTEAHQHPSSSFTIELKKGVPVPVPPSSDFGAAPSLVQLGTRTRARTGMGSKLAGPSAQEWYGTLRVGTPPQEFTVAFDTGSGNLILPDVTCTSMACHSHRSYDASLSVNSQDIAYIDDEAAPVPKSGNREQVVMTIGHGELQGNVVEDLVCMGKVADICSKTKFISATRMDDAPFGLLPYDGILGLGLPESSVTLDFNLMGNLATHKVFRNDRFAVWLKGPHDTDASELTVGAFRPERLASEIVWLNVKRGSGLWVVPMEDFAIDDKKLNICAGGCNAALDTGTSVIGGPSAQINAVIAEVGVKDDCSNYMSLPKVGIAVEHYILNLENKDYVVRTDDGCFHQFMAIDIPPPKGPLVLLGDPFLRRFYTIFDRDSLKVGISLSKHKSGDDQEDPMALADKLVVHH